MSIDAANMPDWLCHSLNLPVESETLLHAFDPILEMDTVPDYWTKCFSYVQSRNKRDSEFLDILDELREKRR